MDLQTVPTSLFLNEMKRRAKQNSAGVCYICGGNLAGEPCTEEHKQQFAHTTQPTTINLDAHRKAMLDAYCIMSGCSRTDAIKQLIDAKFAV